MLFKGFHIALHTILEIKIFLPYSTWYHIKQHITLKVFL